MASPHLSKKLEMLLRGVDAYHAWVFPRVLGPLGDERGTYKPIAPICLPRDGISLHAHSHAEVSVHAEPLIRSRTLGGRALSSMCGVACFVSCCHRTAATAATTAANGLFSMSLSWLRGRFSVFDPPARLRFPCVVFPPAHVYY